MLRHAGFAVRTNRSRKLFIFLCVVIASGFSSPVAAFSLTGVAQGAMAKIKPVAAFFSTFGKSLSNALLNTGYNDRSFMIYTPPAANVDPAKAGTPYGIGYDFGFRAGGDIQSPFGFQIDSLGRFKYTPMTAMLYPGMVPDFTDPTGEKRTPLSLGDGVAPQLIKGLLSLVVGGKANAEKVWAPIGYFTVVQPETVFFLRLLTLLNSARKNTQVGASGKTAGRYPTLTDVPYELMVLLFRLVITPDISATIKLNNGEGPERSVRWTKVATLSRPSKLVSKMPKFFVDLVQTFKPSIDSREIQEYKDRFSAPRSKLQDLYSTARMQRPYESRVAFIKDKIIDGIDVKTLNPTDLDLLDYLIRQIVSERFRGFKTFISSMTVESNVIVDESGITDLATEDGAASADDTLLVSIDVARMTDFMARRIPKIKEFIAYLRSDAKKGMLSESTQKYLSAIEGSIDREFAEFQQLAVDLTNARQAVATARAEQGASFSPRDPSKLLEQSISMRITDKLDAIDAQEAGELAGPTGNKVAVPLLAYLDIKFWQTMRTMQQTFKGDKNYVYDDARLSLQKALVQAYAVSFRANSDLTYLENLVKTDSRSFVVSDMQGGSQTVSGQQLYKEYTDAERYLLYCEQKFSTYKASLGKSTPDQLLKDTKLAQLSKDADNAAILFGKARSAFRHALRQFEFDRRLPRAQSVGIVLLGEASMNGLGDVNVIGVPGAAQPEVAASVTPAPGSTPPTSASAQASATTEVEATAKVSASASASVSFDDPMAAFGEFSIDGAAAASGSGSSEAGVETPAFDDPFGMSGKVLPLQTPQQKALGIAPEKYDYPRTINAFLRQEFARILLRCPDFANFATANFDVVISQATGMHVSELLEKSAGEISDIEKQEDLAYLPDDSFFESPTPSGAIGAGTLSGVDMDALGKDLAAKYGMADPADSQDNSSEEDAAPEGSQEGAVEDEGFDVSMSAEEQQALDAEATQTPEDPSAVSEESSTAVEDPIDQTSAEQQVMGSQGMGDVQQGFDEGMNDQSAPDLSNVDPSMMNQVSAEAAAMEQPGQQMMYDPSMYQQQYSLVTPQQFGNQQSFNGQMQAGFTDQNSQQMYQQYPANQGQYMGGVQSYDPSQQQYAPQQQFQSQQQFSGQQQFPVMQ